MALRPIVPGLRVMVNPSHDVGKVSLVVPAGDVLEVSDGVAAQLERQGFRGVEVAAPAAAPEIVAPAEGDSKPKGKKA
jgi:hypothetical protein